MNKIMSGKLSVSLMCANLINLENDIRIFEDNNVDYIHIDIMDGSFVPNLTFGPDLVNAVRRITNIPLDIHLLLNHPRLIIRSLDIQNNDIVTIHSECKESIMENAAFVKQKGAKFGLALNPDTTIEEIKKYLPFVDSILIMLTVPGFAGMQMLHGIMNKVKETKEYLQKHGLNGIEICVDGNVNDERARYMYSLGAKIFVGGTAGIFYKNADLKESILNFKRSITI